MNIKCNIYINISSPSFFASHFEMSLNLSLFMLFDDFVMRFFLLVLWIFMIVGRILRICYGSFNCVVLHHSHRQRKQTNTLRDSPKNQFFMKISSIYHSLFNVVCILSRPFFCCSFPKLKSWDREWEFLHWFFFSVFFDTFSYYFGFLGCHSFNSFANLLY